MERLSTINFALCLLSLFYVAVNIVGLLWNCRSQEYRESIEVPVHNLEFSSTLLFAVVNVCALVYSPRSITSIAKTSNHSLLKCVVFVNVVTACVAPMLYALDSVSNEVISHEIEYTNEVCTSFIDLVLLRTLISNKRADRQQPAIIGDLTSWAFVLSAFIFAVVQTLVYNLCDNGEQLAHFMEFSFGIAAGGISFWFCIDNKRKADDQKEMIVCGCQSGHHSV